MVILVIVFYETIIVTIIYYALLIDWQGDEKLMRKLNTFCAMNERHINLQIRHKNNSPFILFDNQGDIELAQFGYDCFNNR